MKFRRKETPSCVLLGSRKNTNRKKVHEEKTQRKKTIGNKPNMKKPQEEINRRGNKPKRNLTQEEINPKGNKPNLTSWVYFLLGLFPLGFIFTWVYFHLGFISYWVYFLMFFSYGFFSSWASFLLGFFLLGFFMDPVLLGIKGLIQFGNFHFLLRFKDQILFFVVFRDITYDRLFSSTDSLA